MKDVSKAADERAAHPSDAPVGSSFETDRQRQKASVGRQFDALDGTRIRKIEALSETEKAGTPKKLRVAAYCRVSTDDIEQALSIHMQRKVYSEKIKANPDWIHVGTYVDDGFSGTNTFHRPAFLKLIEDCRAGKIDMIITKAVSRFARNLLDCIGYIEELSNLDPPVRVFFEQEGLDTSVQTSGIILFVLAMNMLRKIADEYRNELTVLGTYTSAEAYEITELDKLLKFAETAVMLNEFSDELFTDFVDHIVVYDRNSIEFKLKCGLTLKEVL